MIMRRANCIKPLHFFTCVLTLYTTSLLAQYRMPANFVPDDDMILVPLEAETTAIESFHNKHEDKFIKARRKLEYWQTQEDYARDYGLEDAGFLDLPTPEEKQKYLQRNYLRFVTKDLERKSNETLREAFEKFNEDDEIESISLVEENEKILVRAQSSRGSGIIQKAEKSVKVGKKKIRFNFLPRVEIGMVRFDMKTPYFNVRSWLGINGNQEVKIERKFRKTKTRAFVNYYIDQSLVLAVIDQKIVDNWSLRLSHTKDINNFDEIDKVGVYEKNVAQVRYHLRF